MDELKVLIEHEWIDFDVEFGQQAPDDIGGVFIASEWLENAIWADLGQEVLQLSVSRVNDKQILLVQFTHYEVEDCVAYTVQLSSEESYTYASRFS